MTVAQQIKQEGREEGLEEGILQGLQNSIVETLEIRFGNVPKTLRKAVCKVSTKTRLQELHRSSVTCSSLEEFANLGLPET